MANATEALLKILATVLTAKAGAPSAIVCWINPRDRLITAYFTLT
jgi:hypothetical protein